MRIKHCYLRKESRTSIIILNPCVCLGNWDVFNLFNYKVPLILDESEINLAYIRLTRVDLWVLLGYPSLENFQINKHHYNYPLAFPLFKMKSKLKTSLYWKISIFLVKAVILIKINTAMMMLYINTKAKVRSPDEDRLLQYCCWCSERRCISTIFLYDLLRLRTLNIDRSKIKNGFTLKKRKNQTISCRN